MEKNTDAVRQLETTLGMLDCTDADVVAGDALIFLSRSPTRFDIVFLDPPFGVIDQGNLCTLLDDGWLADGAHVYIEMRHDAELPELPTGWAIVRDKSAGNVRFVLACAAG